MAKGSGKTPNVAQKKQNGNLPVESLREFFSGVHDEGSRDFKLQRLASRGSIERESDLKLVNEIISKRKSWENATNSELIAIASLERAKSRYLSDKGLEENRKYNELSSKLSNARSKIKKEEYRKALDAQEPKTFAQLRKDKETAQNIYDKVDNFLKGYKARYQGSSGWRDMVYRNYRKIGREDEIFGRNK